MVLDTSSALTRDDPTLDGGLSSQHHSQIQTQAPVSWCSSWPNISASLPSTGESYFPGHLLVEDTAMRRSSYSDANIFLSPGVESSHGHLLTGTEPATLPNFLSAPVKQQSSAAAGDDVRRATMQRRKHSSQMSGELPPAFEASPTFIPKQEKV